MPHLNPRLAQTKICLRWNQEDGQELRFGKGMSAENLKI